MEKLLLKVPEAAELAGISRSMAYELVASGEWPKVTIGTAIRIPIEGLRAWIDRNTIPPRDQVTAGLGGAVSSSTVA